MTVRRVQLLPAVDILGGQAVHLTRGRASSTRVVGKPLQLALRWQAAGARWVHLVDLDAAFGRPGDQALVRDVVGRLDADVQLSAGVRDDPGLTAALATGCRRVVVAAAALADLDWCARVVARHTERVAVALDVREGRVAARGTQWVGPVCGDVVDRLDAAGCRCYVVTDVERDGALSGPNLDLLRDVCRRSQARVVASGGVSTLDDLRRLAGLAADGLDGVVVGAALHTQAFSVREALAVLEYSGVNRPASP